MFQLSNDDASWSGEKWPSRQPVANDETPDETEESYSDFSFCEIQSVRNNEIHPSAECNTGLENYTGETVTVKFNVNYDKTEQQFTKAFSRHATIDVIKSELASLLQIPTYHVSLQKDDVELNDAVLASLGIPALGIIQLDVKITPACKLDKTLIYGYMPTLDVITVRIRQNKVVKHLIVEIEDERGEKPWLGGYRHRITGTRYHHASTQTCKATRTSGGARSTRCTQATLMKTQQTNTTIDKSVQISPHLFSIPSRTDYVIHSKEKSYPQAVQLDNLEFHYDQHEPAEPNSSLADPLKRLEPLRDHIETWNAIQNAHLRSLPNDRQTSQRTAILNQTVKFINRLNALKSKLRESRKSSDQIRLFDNYTKPKIILSKTGSEIPIQTIFNQKAQKLRHLFIDYINDSTTLPNKLTVIRSMIEFFRDTSSGDKFSAEIISLLEQHESLLDHDIRQTTLQLRIRQRIGHFLQYAGRVPEPNRELYEMLPFAHIPPQINTPSYWKLLDRLRNDEIKRFGCFTSICFKLRPAEFAYLIRDIWNNTTISNETLVNSETNQHVVTRWNTRLEWTPWNCVLLTKPNLQIHLKVADVETFYRADVLSNVKNNHLKAKIHFQRLLQ